MRTLVKAAQTAHLEERRWQDELDSFLLNYRSTPHCTTGISPAELLFNRKIRNKLPSVSDSSPSQDNEAHKEATQRDAKQKEKMKSYADQHNRAKKIELKIGDHVLVRERKKNKLSTPFSKSTYKITAIKGSMITATGRDSTVTRNASTFKRVPASNDPIQDDDTYDSDTDNSSKETTNSRRYPMRENRCSPDFYK